MIFNGYISTDIFQRIYFNGYISTDIFQRIYFNGYISTDIWISKIHTNQCVYPSKHRFLLDYCNHRLRSCHRASNLFLQM